MAIAGAAAGAARSLEAIMAEQMLQAKLAQQQAMEQARLQLDQRQVEGMEQDRAEGRRLQGQQVELGERSRRDRNNQQGLELMQADKATMDTDAALAGLPPRLRQIADLRRVGVTGISPQDLNTPEETAAAREADDEADIQKQIRIRNATREPRQPDYQRVMVDGKETFLTPDEVRQRGGVDAASRKRASTGIERQALGFYNRMNEALDTMDSVEDQITERDLMLINNSPLPDLINNRLLSSAGQQYAQALSTYTEARLRKESGAAIPASEYESDRRTIGRQANDQDPVRAQKKQTRRKTAEGVAYSSGPAYEEFYGEPFKRMPDSVGVMQKRIPGIEGGIAESKDGGKTWTRVK